MDLNSTWLIWACDQSSQINFGCFPGTINRQHSGTNIL